MSSVASAQLILLILALAVAMLAWLLARRGLHELLGRTVILPGGVMFYDRAFSMLLFFGAIGAAFSHNLNVKPGDHFMEYVWDIASGFGDVLGYLFISLTIYLVLMTILVAALKPKNEQ
jgi:cation transporter-like permease